MHPDEENQFVEDDWDYEVEACPQCKRREQGEEAAENQRPATKTVSKPSAAVQKKTGLVAACTIDDDKELVDALVGEETVFDIPGKYWEGHESKTFSAQIYGKQTRTDHRGKHVYCKVVLRKSTSPNQDDSWVWMPVSGTSRGALSLRQALKEADVKIASSRLGKDFSPSKKSKQSQEVKTATSKALKPKTASFKTAASAKKTANSKKAGTIAKKKAVLTEAMRNKAREMCDKKFTFNGCVFGGPDYAYELHRIEKQLLTSSIRAAASRKRMAAHHAKHAKP
jgi:hypothetical protein